MTYLSGVSSSTYCTFLFIIIQTMLSFLFPRTWTCGWWPHVCSYNDKVSITNLLCPVGIVGEIDEGGEGFSIWTHKRFDIGYNDNKIVDVNLTSEAKVKLAPNAKISFSYEVGAIHRSKSWGLGMWFTYTVNQKTMTTGHFCFSGEMACLKGQVWWSFWQVLGPQLLSAQGE